MARTRRKSRERLLALRPQRSRRQGAHDLAPDAALQAIWDVVAMIPAGRVRTYGDVARVAGLPGRARQTGYALRMMPRDLHLPWHRVVGAGGRIVFPGASKEYREQSRRLRGEGISVRDGRVPSSALME